MKKEKRISLHSLISTQNYPAYNAGRLGIFAFSVAFVTGLYLFLYYKIDPSQAYSSTEEISRQWIGNLMRSLHRYSSDLLVIAASIHFIETFIHRKYSKKNSWFTGLATYILIPLLGITGFVLVWDQKAKLIGLLSGKILAALPFIDKSFLGMFLIEQPKALSGLFRIMFVAHFFLSLIFAFISYFHVYAIGRRKLLPSRQVMLISSLFLIIYSLVSPVKSDPPAYNHLLSYHSTIDWFYLWGLYPLRWMNAPKVLIGILLSGVLLLLLPVIKQHKNYTSSRKKATLILNIIFLLLFFTLPFLSNFSFSYYSPEQKILIIQMKYTSSPTETAHFNASVEHMKYRGNIIKRRANISLSIMNKEGYKLYEKEFSPAGFHKNASIILYEEIPINSLHADSLKVILQENSSDSIRYETPFFMPASAQVVSFHNNQLILISAK